MALNDLREFIQAARALGDVKEIHGANWDLEIGALVTWYNPESWGWSAIRSPTRCARKLVVTPE